MRRGQRDMGIGGGNQQWERGFPASVRSDSTSREREWGAKVRAGVGAGRGGARVEGGQDRAPHYYHIPLTPWVRAST